MSTPESSAAPLGTPEEMVTRLKLVLPPPPPRGGIYQPIVIVGDLAYVSGHGPIQSDGTFITGQAMGPEDLPAAQAAARQTALAILATLRKELGSLNRIHRLVKLLGMVNAGPRFLQHPLAINGASELFAAVFGPELGVGARSAVGFSSLPNNILTEIEGIFELKK